MVQDLPCPKLALLAERLCGEGFAGPTQPSCSVESVAKDGAAAAHGGRSSNDSAVRPSTAVREEGRTSVMVAVLHDIAEIADAAGATAVEVFCDERQHGRQSLLQPGLAAMQGPALCLRIPGTFWICQGCVTGTPAICTHGLATSYLLMRLELCNPK